MTETRNQVIEAGAGTGKTYSLVQAILQALFQRQVPLSGVVALTFTKKAAGEMKERIADELRRIVTATTLPDAYRTWGHRLEELQNLARAALDQIDRANISTIHSFSYSLLKRFPLAAGINPDSEVDEKGVRYGEIFELEWPRWLAGQLRLNAPHAADWLDILSRVTLSQVEGLARRLSDFDTPLYALPLSDDDLPQRLGPLHEEVRALVAAHPASDKSGHVASACEELMGAAASGDWEKLEQAALARRDDLRLEPAATKAWTKPDIRRLKYLQRVALNLARRGDRVVSLLTRRLRPFVVHFRAKALADGSLSNSALLALACELVRKNHEVRTLLKTEFRAIFIDEFQDTDPLQGELLLFLSEKIGGHARRWSEVELEAGKLFVVGDPKQSIYRFRGADIAAYRQITDLILTQGGTARPLQTSRRSHAQIIQVVNQAFGQIIQENKMISPAYVPLEPLRQGDNLPLQGVELRLAKGTKPLSADEALELEALDSAEWIDQHVGRDEILDKRDGKRPLRYRDVALVFRSTPAMRPFIESLRERDIPFVVEGERYFFSTPEVTDLVNFLRVVENPQDSLALVGLLRSPLGGFTDKDILLLKEKKCLDASRGLPSDFSDGQQRVWRLLQHLHTRVGREPLKVLLRHLFEESFVLELAARSYHRDQTVANLLKLRRLLESFAEEGITTLRTLLQKVRAFMEDDRLEGESPLADETYDAIRLMTIHKAKGLEFPVVMLPTLHKGQNKRSTPDVIFDWSSGRLGLRIADLQNFDKFMLDWENQEREAEEEKRVLYVAMTRARERLVLSGGVGLLRPTSECYLEWLRNAWGLDWTTISEGPHPVGQTQITIGFMNAEKRPRVLTSEKGQSPALALEASEFAAEWKARREEEKTLRVTPLVIRPSQLAAEAPPKEDHSDIESPETTVRAERGLLLGTLLHRFLEEWDWKEEKCAMPAQLRTMANRYFASLGILSEPFPDPKVGTPSSQGAMQDLVLIVNEAQTILADFIGSEAYDDIGRADILARELPFFYRRDDGSLVRGSMDIVYKTSDGSIIVGDYKTFARHHETRYEAQGGAYVDAIQRALGQPARFKVIALRESRTARPSHR